MCRLQEQDVIKIPTRMELQTDLGCPQGYKIISKFQPPWNFKLTWIVHKVIRRYQNSHPSEPRVSQSAFKIPQSYTLCFTIQVSQSVRQVSQSDWQFAESVWEVWRSDREVSQSDADDFGFRILMWSSTCCVSRGHSACTSPLTTWHRHLSFFRCWAGRAPSIIRMYTDIANNIHAWSRIPIIYSGFCYGHQGPNFHLKRDHPHWG